MKITSGEIARFIANEISVPHEEAQIGCDIMESIASTEGINLTRKKLISGALITSCMKQYDDQFDKGSLEETKKSGQLIIESVNSPTSPDNISGSLLRGINLAQSNFSSEAYDVLKRLSLAQKDSQRQKNNNITQTEVEKITKKKGELTMLLFALEVNPNMSEECQSCYKALGYLLQLIDDFRDVHLDIEDGICTLMTLAENQQEAIIIIFRQYQRVKMLFTNTYSEKKLNPIFTYMKKLMQEIGFNV